MIIENLFQGRGVPVGTSPEKVLQVMIHLRNMLEWRLNFGLSIFIYLPSGVDRAARKILKETKKRKKISSLITICANFLGVDDPIDKLPSDWHKKGINCSLPASHVGDSLWDNKIFQGLE